MRALLVAVVSALVLLFDFAKAAAQECARSTSVSADCYVARSKETVHSARGFDLLQAKKYDAAVAAYTKAIAVDPKAASNYNNRAQAYQGLKAYDKTFADFATAIRLAPRNDLYLSNRAATHELLQDFASAKADLLAALAINPKNSSARFALARAHYYFGDYALSVDVYSALIKESPRDASALVWRAGIYRAMNLPDKALADLRCAEIAPKNAYCFASRADAHRIKGDLKKARADVEAALRIDTKEDLAYRVRADIAAAEGNQLAAFQDYSRAIDIDGKYVQAYLNRGKLLIEMGHTREALQDLDTAASLDKRTAWEIHLRGIAKKLAEDYRKELRAAAVDRPILIFFDYGLTDVTDAADPLIEFASQVILDKQAASIQIVGYVDAEEFKESPDLAMVRAYAVRTALIRKGVAAGSLSVAAGAEADRLVPTTEREPQNRRVMITFRK